MTFLPIVERELRTGARRPATHWLRFAVAGVVLVLWMILALGGQRFTQPTELGRNLFTALGVLGLGFCLLAGIFLTSDCLSVEKRDGTLGLLFLTDLHGFDVVLGKLVTTSLQAVYALLAVLPMLALSVLLGGVSGGEVLRLVLALLVTLFLSLSLGMAVSALSRETPHAMLVTFFLILGLSGGLPTLSGLLDSLDLVNFSSNPLHFACPVFAYAWSFDSAAGFGKGHLRFLIAIATLTTIGLTALGLACRRLPRDFGDESGGRKTPSKSAPPTRLTWPPQLDDNPFEWLASREGRLHRIATRTMLILLLPWLGCLGLALKSDNSLRDFGFTVCMFGAFALHLLAKCFIAVEASRRFNQDRASGALELLLATPLSPEDIVQGQRRASLAFGGLPVLICLLTNLLLIWLIAGPDPMQMGREGGIFVGIYLGGAIALVLDAFALGWAGMVAGLRHSRQHRAVLATLGKVLLAPWIGIFVFFFLSLSGRGWSNEDVKGMIALWFLLGGGISLAVGFKARADLMHGFRRLVSGDASQTRSTPRAAPPEVSTTTHA